MTAFRPGTNMSRLSVAAAAVLAIVLAGACRRGDPAATAKDGLGWLPRAPAHDAEVATIPAGATISYYIPTDAPVRTHSEGWGGIDTFGNFVPTDKKSLIVDSGALVSRLGTVEKRATYGDWSFVYADEKHQQHAGWGLCLTDGELLVPRSALEVHAPGTYVDNVFAIESFGPDYVLVRLDHSRGHHLCMWRQDSQGQEVPTVAFTGSRIEVGGRVIERRTDGWYEGERKVGP